MSGRAGPVLLILLVILGGLAGLAGGPSLASHFEAKLYPSPFVDKHLFLHTDRVNNILDRIDHMNTSGITNPPSTDYDFDLRPGVTLRNRLSPFLNLFGFVMNSSGHDAFARGFHVWNATAFLYLAANVSGAYQLNVSLYQFQAPLSFALLGFVNQTVLLQSFAVRVPFIFPTIDTVVPRNETLYLFVTRVDLSPAVVILGFDVNDAESRLVVRTDTYVHIESPSGIFVGGNPRTLLSDWEPYTILVNVSDPFGAPHIEKAWISVFDPNSVLVASSGNLSVPTAADSSSVPAWRRFEFAFPALEAPGTYRVRLNATDVDRLLHSGLKVPQNWNTSYSFTFDLYVTLDHFFVSGPAAAEAGAPFSLAVEARARADYLVPNWTGSVALTPVPPVWETPGTLGIQAATVVNGSLVLAGESYTRAHPVRIEAANGSITGLSGQIQVSPAPPAAVSILQPSLYITTAGLTETFQAVAQDVYGNLNNSWTALWSGTGSGAGVSPIGALTATVAGAGTITVSPQGSSGVDATLSIIVLPAAVSTITLFPAAPVVGLVAGANQTFLAEGQDAYGNLNLTWQASWSLDDPTLGVLVPTDHTAVLTPTKVGSTTLRVTNGSIGDSVGLSIAPGPIAAIQLNPSGIQLLDSGANRTIVAAAYDAYGNEVTTWSPTWQVNGSIGQLVGTGPVVLFIAGGELEQGSIIVTADGISAELGIIVKGGIAAAQPPWVLIGGIAAAAAAAAGGAFFWLRPKRRTIIDEVFLMTPSGLLIKHFTRRLKPDQDDSILAGMLTAVQDFVKDSFRESGSEVDEIKFKDFRIMIARTPHVLLAAVASGERTDVLQVELNRVARTVEERYGAKLTAWSGDLSELAGVETVVSELFAK